MIDLIKNNWEEMKGVFTIKKLKLQYVIEKGFYKIFCLDGNILYKYAIKIENPASEEQQDFEDNYKDDCNKNLEVKNIDGKTEVVASSRPLNTTTSFTTCGDTPSEIGGGKRIEWDFSNSDDEITAPEGYKIKRIIISFIDNVWVKDGSMYFFNKQKGSYLDFKVICPKGQYYYKNDGTIALADEDVVIERYVNKHGMQGSCPMGDEINTESATTNPIPPNYELWVEITVPDTDTSSNGYAEIELYRERTVILE